MSKREQIEERYRRNIGRLASCTDYIYDQWSDRVKDLEFGRRGHIGREGCGAVALHNAVKYIGKEQNFCDLLRDMEELDMTWLGARFGTKPWSLSRYFGTNKIPFQKYKSPNDFKAALLTHKIGIVCTWNRRFKGMHFYGVYYSLEENKYYTANLHPTGKGFQAMELHEMSNLRFIVGYAIQDAVNA